MVKNVKKAREKGKRDEARIDTQQAMTKNYCLFTSYQSSVYEIRQKK